MVLLAPSATKVTLSTDNPKMTDECANFPSTPTFGPGCDSSQTDMDNRRLVIGHVEPLNLPMGWGKEVDILRRYDQKEATHYFCKMDETYDTVAILAEKRFDHGLIANTAHRLSPGGKLVLPISFHGAFKESLGVKPKYTIISPSDGAMVASSAIRDHSQKDLPSNGDNRVATPAIVSVPLKIMQKPTHVVQCAFHREFCLVDRATWTKFCTSEDVRKQLADAAETRFALSLCTLGYRMYEMLRRDDASYPEDCSWLGDSLLVLYK